MVGSKAFLKKQNLLVNSLGMFDILEYGGVS